MKQCIVKRENAFILNTLCIQFEKSRLYKARSNKKGEIMKTKKRNSFLVLCILIVGLSVGSIILGTSDISAIADEKNNQLEVDLLQNQVKEGNITEVVSTESTSTSLDSSLAVDSAGNVHIVWMDNTDYLGAGPEADIFYKRWDSKLLDWTVTEVVSTETETQGGSFYPSLAVDSKCNVHVTWTGTDLGGTMNDYQIYYKRWNASSLVWTSTELVSSESTSYSAFSSLVVDTEGNIHISWMDTTNYLSAGTDEDILYKQLIVSSSSWTTAEVVSTESSADSTAPSMAIDSLNNNVHISWEDRTDYSLSGVDRDIFYKKRDFISSTWTTTEIVSTESTDSSENPSLSLDSSRNIHIAWMDFSDYTSSTSSWDVFYKQWNTLDSSWSNTTVLSTESTSASLQPSLGVDSTGCVYVVWHDSTSYSGSGIDWDIVLKRWDSAFPKWTEPIVVSTESTLDSLYPSLGVDSVGDVYISWHDDTNYDISGTDTDIFFKKFSSYPSTPELAFIVPNPTDSDNIYLDWNNITGSQHYYVYRSDYYIWSIEELEPINKVSSSFYIDTLPFEGYFYYVIVAGNFAGNSSHSNCQYVEYRLPHVREFTIISSLILGVVVISLVVMKSRRNRLK